MASIIMAAPPVTGELQPILQIAAALVQRGHHVTVLTGSRFGAQVAGTGARFVALTGAADFDDRRMMQTFPEMGNATSDADQLNFRFGLMADAIPSEHEQLQALFAADPDAALITNSVFLGHWALALGAPGHRPPRWLAIGCNPLALPSADTTPMGPLPPGPDGDARAANRAANAQYLAMLEPSRLRIEAAVRSLGATAPVPGFVDGIITVPEIFAALTVPGLEFERSDAPDSLQFVGVLPASMPADWTPPDWWAELDAGRPVVAVTQGTLANHDLGELVRPTLDALENEDVMVVAALGRESEALPGSVPSNARVEPFIPFGALLPKVSVFVTNGGFGATQQALAARVPVVVAGATEEKPLVAARVAARGVGRDLKTSTPSPAQLREAVLGLLTDGAVRRNVDRLAAEYAQYDAVGRIESLLFGN
jgi:UDP:flavonoid glycosyltransferase YjiC (YdhE family)